MADRQVTREQIVLPDGMWVKRRAGRHYLYFSTARWRLDPDLFDDRYRKGDELTVTSGVGLCLGFEECGGPDFRNFEDVLGFAARCLLPVRKRRKPK